MGLKFVIQPDPVLINNFRLDIVGLPSITFTAVGALEQETDKVELPDRTTTSGGRDKPGEAEISVPAHHAVEIAAMNAWRQEAKDPISPLFKKVGTLTAWGGALTTQLVKTIMGAWLSKDGTPDFEMTDDGEMAVIKYTLCWDQLL